MKPYYLSSLFLLFSLNSIAYTFTKPADDNTVGAMIGSFYTGCMSGIMAVIENKYYDNKGEDVKVAFGKMKQTCKIHQAAYAKELRKAAKGR